MAAPQAAAAPARSPHQTLGRSASGVATDPVCDLALRIRWQRNREALSGQALHFEVTASDPSLGIHDRPFGPVLLDAEPQKIFERLYERLSYVDPGSEDRVRIDGASLGEELLPAELQQILWRHCCQDESPKTLWIYSEEMWIPWEILVLRVQVGGRWQAGPTLGEAFAVTRGRPGLVRWPWLPIRNLGAVFADRSGLAQLPKERDFLKSLSGPERRVDMLTPERGEVLAAMERGEYDAWHLAGHGEWGDGEASFNLGGSRLGPAEVAVAAPNLGESRPLVFVNACNLARAERGLVRWYGWAAKLADLQVGAFVGALWPIQDDAALLFAQTFYKRFIEGATLAAAVHAARRAAKEGIPGDTSWLAFVAYGDPAARCMAAPEAETTAAKPVIAPAPLLEVLQPVASERSGHRRGGRSRRLILLRKALPGLFMLASALLFVVLTGLRSPTRIRLEVRASSLEATLAEVPGGPFFDSMLAFSRLEARRFARAEMHDGGERTPIDSVRASSPAANLVVATPKSAGAKDGSSFAHVTTLEDLELASGSRLALRVQPFEGGFDLSFDLVPEGLLHLPLFGPFEIETSEIYNEGASSGSRFSDVLRFAVGAEFSLTLFPNQDGLALAGIVGPAAATVPLLAEPLAISAVDLMAFDGEAWRSSLLDEAQLAFPEMPGREPVTIPEDHFLRLGAIRELDLQRLSLDPETGGFRAVLEGVVNEIRSGQPGAVRDHRPTYYERWLGSLLWTWWVTWLAGSGTVYFGAVRLRRYLREARR